MPACTKPSPVVQPVEPPPTVAAVRDEPVILPLESPSPPPDPCEDHDGLVLSPPAVIAADWQGATTMGGSGSLGILWCGEGKAVLQFVKVSRPGAEGTSSEMTARYELDPDRSALEPGDSRTTRIHAPASPGPLAVMAVAIDEERRLHEAHTSLEVIEDPERTAQREQCLADGGSWAARGMLGIESCSRPTTDAGKRCLSGSDCEGACIEDQAEAIGDDVLAGVEVPRCSPGREPRLLVGKCDDRTLRFGCHPRLRAVTVACLWPRVSRRALSVCVD
ncbi:MAG: hypothetical protein AB1Z98_33695 [Nannocystaceae bacterium]